MTCVLLRTPSYSNACTGRPEEVSDHPAASSGQFQSSWRAAQTLFRSTTTARRISGSSSTSDVTFLDGVVAETAASDGNAEQTAEGAPVTPTCQSEREPLSKNNSLSTAEERDSDIEYILDMCNKSRTPDIKRDETSRVLKRKLDTDIDLDVPYIPPKRISPFMNTPKEKKEEKRKILKISIKKLKQLEDPEAFLRRTVLVNNTRKRLQTELRQEKNSSRVGRRKHFISTYDVLSNSCLSNSYMFDDPFLSGVHEKITDDMTDTLISNLQDRLCENKEGDSQSESLNSNAERYESESKTGAIRSNTEHSLENMDTSVPTDSSTSLLNVSENMDVINDAFAIAQGVDSFKNETNSVYMSVTNSEKEVTNTSTDKARTHVAECPSGNGQTCSEQCHTVHEEFDTMIINDSVVLEIDLPNQINSFTSQTGVDDYIS
ncbi:uncharacterized protein LOC128207420 [Mya arenaria]|uniref:uncharacterized protein LOC128207420 n=1 Tax=Mya arenaria TaxID=6604 RepID=UPI0022E6F83A|nr:uncharacterized protein LOC128207420 [Mya arenaria]